MHNSIQIFSATINIRSAAIRMLAGAFIGFLIISFFVFGIDNPNPAWPSNWRIRPLIVTPLIVAIGSLSFYLGDVIGLKPEKLRLLTFLLSAFLFLVSIWMGMILGLAGTMWN